MTGGRLEEAGDRQLGHPLQPPSPIKGPSLPPAKAGETTIIVIAAPSTSFFMVFSHWPRPRIVGYKHGDVHAPTGSFVAWRKLRHEVRPIPFDDAAHLVIDSSE